MQVFLAAQVTAWQLWSECDCVRLSKRRVRFVMEAPAAGGSACPNVEDVATCSSTCAYIVMVYVVIAYIVMAFIVTAYAVMAYV